MSEQPVTFEARLREQKRQSWHRRVRRGLKRKRLNKKKPDPIARHAHSLLGAAVRHGKILRPGFCSSCGVFCKPEAHHPNYSEPLKVIWLCSMCHGITRRKDVLALLGGK